MQLSAVDIALVAFGLILASVAIGLMMRYWLPEEHISGDSKEVIRLATALIGTMAAVVLALLFASTRTSFEATNSSVGRMSAATSSPSSHRFGRTTSPPSARRVPTGRQGK